ncbi:Trafficking protein particle complex subunit 12 [Morus notabilis]|uniref:Trafficking protein particle complex subunit 12 n=1 Tax=Morus notabilis TaxID=981085 RepID=W9QL80_9ROSA|nr:trafficking protein particle complex subunit 12 [Morus notabilis]EXB39773.1 Trafficking protein particle complex subunit 12 [Morus notabilis]
MDADSPDPQTLTVSDDPLTGHFASFNDLSHELSSLHELAVRGSWRSVLDKVARARSLSLLQKPHDHLTYLSFNVVALIKLRRFADASAELDSLDDLDGSHYRYESYPNDYPNRTGSMVPFSLRWCCAVIPIKLGRRQDGLDRLYALLDFVRNKVIEKKDRKDLSVSARVWKNRELLMTNSIIGVHLSAKEFSVCLNLIKELLDRGFLDPILLSKLGYIQMQIGDLEGAKSSFNRVEGLMKKNDWELSEIQLENLVNRNKALVYLVGKDYVSAVREYEECIERDGADVVAINNKAICLMYLRDLSDSIKVLENALERVPTVALNETLVVNLCSMYELAYVNHSDIKRTLSNWIARVAPDDFDSSCTRI